MANSYYFLVAGLPDIFLDNTKKTVSFSGFINEISDQVSEEDTALLKLLQLPYDNYNLINLLEKRDKEFDNRGSFSKEELEQEIKLPELTPEYMRTFIEDYKEGKFLFPDLVIDDQLSWLFYDEMAGHGNEFIREWFTFEVNFRNVLAGLNCRDLAQNQSSTKDAGTFLLSQSVICRNDVSELILKSNAPDFSLSNSLPWIEKLLTFSQENMTDFERNIDTLRWEAVNELITFSYFHIETILAFCIKLGMVERWQKLDPATGQQKLEKLLEELNSGFHFTEDF